MSEQCNEISFSAVHAFRPRIAGPGVSDEKNAVFLLLFVLARDIYSAKLLDYRPQYAERTASFFSSASGLGFPSSSNFSEAIMRSSLTGKTLLCAPVSTLH